MVDDHRKTVIIIDNNESICKKYKELFIERLPNVILRIYNNTSDGLTAIFKNNFDVAIINSNLYEDHLSSKVLVRKCVLSGKPVICTENNIINKYSVLYNNSDIKNKNIKFIDNHYDMLETVQKFFSKKIDPLIISAELNIISK